MEKRVPHCRLAVIKTFVLARKVRATQSALIGAAQLGLDFEGVIEVLEGLNHQDFFKSMTTHYDHRVWQDVYRPRTKVGEGTSSSL